MHSEKAAAMLDELRAVDGGRLCVPCASVRLQVDSDGVHKAIRELVATGHVLCGMFRCPLCRTSRLVVFLRPFGLFGFRPRDV